MGSQQNGTITRVASIPSQERITTNAASPLPGSEQKLQAFGLATAIDARRTGTKLAPL